jgi:atypical dual specificity phosphatase
MPRNFSFIIEGKLFAMECPGTHAPLEEDLAFLRSQGIGCIVSLTENCVEPDIVAQRGFFVVHIPIRDFTPPTMEQCRRFVTQVDEWLKTGRTVVVHCGAGYGRTGTMTAIYLVWQGLSAAEAIRRIRTQRPNSIETSDQEFAIRDFENALAVERMKRPEPPPNGRGAENVV